MSNYFLLLWQIVTKISLAYHLTYFKAPHVCSIIHKVWATATATTSPAHCAWCSHCKLVYDLLIVHAHQKLKPSMQPCPCCNEQSKTSFFEDICSTVVSEQLNVLSVLDAADIRGFWYERVNVPPSPASIVVWNLLNILQKLLSDVRFTMRHRIMPVIQDGPNPQVLHN